MLEVSGHFLILVQPQDDERLKPPMGEGRGRDFRSDAQTTLKPELLCVCVCVYSRRVLGYSALEEGQVLAVLVVEPLHFEVQVHVVCTLTQPVLLML